MRPEHGIDRPAVARAFLEPGHNCWQVCDTDALSVIIDGAAYFRALREAIIAAREQVLLVGWDFDLEIELLPGESDPDGLAPDGYPNSLQDFIEAIVEEKPDLRIHLLRWTGSVVIAPGRVVPMARLKMAGSDRIQVAFDGRHPVGACHHQKIVVVDDRLAFCGGIDATVGRWDTPEHAPDDPRRRLRGGEVAMPWHDVATALTGAVARQLGALARLRWERATGATLAVPHGAPAIWPASLTPVARDVSTAIARTEPPEQDREIVNEIEELLLGSIGAARRLIYLESQYFAAEAVAEALAARLAEPDGPEIVVINPQEAQYPLEDAAMHRERERLLHDLAARDPFDRFRIWTPVNAAGGQIYVHAKVCVIDDWLLRVGSSNLNSRSLGFDTECDVAVLGETAATRRAIETVRNTLVAEHLGTTVATLEDAIAARRGSVVAAMDALNRPVGRGLRRVEPKEDNALADLVARSGVFDPRYERGARRRKGVTSRHLGLGLAALATGYVVWRLVAGGGG